MEEKRVVLSFGSFVLMGVTIGVTSGFVFGLFFSLRSLISGSLLEALIAVPVATVGNGISAGFCAAVGYFIYKRAVARFYKLGVLSGKYEEPVEPGDIAFAEKPRKSSESTAAKPGSF